MSNQPPPQTRMVLVDGLRGLAAMAIVLPHAWAIFRVSIQTPGWTYKLVFDGRIYAPMAVHVFFVLSGFVIAYTLRDVRVTLSTFFRFLLRRSIRLDPPYLVSMLLSLSVIVLLTGPHAVPPPRVLLAHLLYLQDLLGFGEPINHIYWTLCLEIQMYIFFCAAIGLLQAVRLNYQITLAVGLILSLGWPLGLLPSPIQRFFLASEYCFLAGAVAWWSIEHSIPRWLLIAVAGAFLVAGSRYFDCQIWVAFATAMLLATAGALGKLNTWLGAKPWQFLGGISYGLYLVHQPICDLALPIQHRLGLTSITASMIVLLLVYLISILLAHALRLTVELPSIRLSHKLKTQKV